LIEYYNKNHYQEH